MSDLTEAELHHYMMKCIEIARETERVFSLPHIGTIVLSADKKIIGIGRKKHIHGMQRTFQHAERSALGEAANNGSTRGGYLFSTHEPCTRINTKRVWSGCDELIVQAKIKTVVFGYEDVIVPESQRSIHYLRRNNVEVIHYAKCSDTIATFSGQRVYSHLRNRNT